MDDIVREGVLCRRPDVSLHFLEDSGVLFDAGRRQLYALNKAAAFIWCCLEEGLSSDEIIHRLENTLGFAAEEARAHFEAMLGKWRDMGLLAQTPGVAERYFGLLDTRFALRVAPDELMEEIAPLLEPLAITSPRGPAITVDVLAGDSGRFSIEAEGIVMETCNRDQLVPALKTSLVRLTLERSTDFCGLHSAAVSLGGRTLLLPGVSGTGKSTMSAAFAAAGYRVLGDDTIVLARETLEARPMPFALCLKPGAWHLLAPRFPALASLPVHHRLDGKHVRYLVPDRAHWVDPAMREPVGWIVFMERLKEGSTKLLPMDRPQALARLLIECMPLGNALDSADVSRLISWIGGVSCFKLRFASLDEAVERLARLAQ
jgi:hypothetical protein